MIGPLLLSVVVAIGAPEPKAAAETAVTEAEMGGHESSRHELSEAERLEPILLEVLASCEKALGAGECGRVDEGEGTWRALVIFTKDGAKVTLSRRNRVIVRSLDFLPEDSEKQRRVAAGLLVAAMTAAARLSEPEKSTTAEGKSQPRQQETRSPTVIEQQIPTPAKPRDEQAERAAFSMQLAALTGPTLGGPHWGVGGLFGLNVQFAQFFGLGGGVQVLHSGHGGWEATSVRGGVGARVLLLQDARPISWQLAVDVVIDTAQIRYEQGIQPIQRALRGGGQLASTWGLGSGKIRPLLGAGLSVLSPGLEIRRNGAVERVVPPLLGQILLGVEWNR